MNVYIITKGDYSDYHIERVFLDESLAKTYARLTDMSVETHTVDESLESLAHGGVSGANA